MAKNCVKYNITLDVSKAYINQAYRAKKRAFFFTIAVHQISTREPTIQINQARFWVIKSMYLILWYHIGTSWNSVNQNHFNQNKLLIIPNVTHLDLVSTLKWKLKGKGKKILKSLIIVVFSIRF